MKSGERLICLYKNKITRWLEEMNFIFSCYKQLFTHSLRSSVKYLFLPLEHKIHIVAPPCNILYVSDVNFIEF